MPVVRSGAAGSLAQAPERHRKMKDQVPQDFGRQMLSSVRWVLALRSVAQLFTWLSTLIVVRFLTPDDYGLNAMLEAPLEIMMLVCTLGIDAALVRRPADRHEDIQAAFGWLIIVNGVLFTTYFFGAPLIADYFDEARLEPIARTLSFLFFLVPLRAIPNALLDRELKFKSKALVELIAAVIAAIVTLTLAVQGTGVWALVIGYLTNKVLSAVGLMVVHPWLVWPKFGVPIGEMLKFGGLLTLASILTLIADRLVSIIAGPTIGPDLLGVYAVAIHISLIPISKTMPIIGPILFPTFARIQDDRDMTARYFVKIVSITYVLFLPIVVGLAITAEETVPLVFGEAWASLPLPLALICIAMPFRLISQLVRPMVSGLGRADIPVAGSATRLVVLIPLVLIAQQHGLVALAAIWLIVEPIVAVTVLRMASKEIGLHLAAVIRGILPAFASATAMGLGVLLMKSVVNVNAVALLVLEILIGASLYLAVMKLAFRDTFASTFEVLFSRSRANGASQSTQGAET